MVKACAHRHGEGGVLNAQCYFWFNGSKCECAHQISASGGDITHAPFQRGSASSRGVCGFVICVPES